MEQVWPNQPLHVMIGSGVPYLLIIYLGANFWIFKEILNLADLALVYCSFGFSNTSQVPNVASPEDLATAADALLSSAHRYCGSYPS